MFLNIVTPCIRPENLKRIAESINVPKENYRWLIVMDMALPKPKPTDLPQNAEIFWQPDNSVCGHGQKNFALQKITKGHVLFLDDDTIMHPYLWNNIKGLEDNDFIHFRQCWAKGMKRLGGHIQVGLVDVGNVVASRKLIGNSLFFDMFYNADGLFMVEVFAKAKHPVYIPEILSIYNALK